MAGSAKEDPLKLLLQEEWIFLSVNLRDQDMYLLFLRIQ